MPRDGANVEEGSHAVVVGLPAVAKLRSPALPDVSLENPSVTEKTRGGVDMQRGQSILPFNWTRPAKRLMHEELPERHRGLLQRPGRHALTKSQVPLSELSPLLGGETDVFVGPLQKPELGPAEELAAEDM
jgi:hypothetical protein